MKDSTARLTCARTAGDRLVHVREHGSRAPGQRREPSLHYFLLAVTLHSRLVVDRQPAGQVTDRRQDAEELDAGVALLADLSEQRVGVVRQDAIVRAWRDRKDLLEITGAEGAVRIFEANLLPLEHGAVGVAEDRQQHLVFELGLDRLPVDVEDAGVARALAVFEHVLPPRVGGLGDAHVIRHQVDDVAHAVGAQ